MTVSGDRREPSKHGTSSSLEHKEVPSPVISSVLVAEAADIELRLRQHCLEMLEPTIRKQGALETRIRECRATIEGRTEEMNELRKVKDDAQHLYKQVEGFRKEMAEWDMQRRTDEQESGDRHSNQEMDLSDLRRALERQKADANSVNRTLIGLGSSLTGTRDEMSQLRSYAVERIDINREKGAKLRDEFEQRMSTVENQMHFLQDAQTSTDTVIHHMKSTMSTMMERVQQADEKIADIWRSKASVNNLQEQQQDLSEFMRHVNTTVASLKQQFGSLVDNVKSHFHEAANVVGTTTATQLEHMRTQYKEELQRVDVVQDDIKAYVAQATGNQKETKAEVTSIIESAKSGINSLQKSVEAAEQKRKVAESNMGVELGQLRKSIADMHASVQHQDSASGLRSDIMDMLVESQLLSAMLDLQDESDRKNISLFGYKSADGGKEKSCTLPDVHGDRSNGGSMSARSPKKRGQAVGGSATAGEDVSAGMGQVLSLDRRCLACSGSHDAVLAGFKMACLSYAPSQIEIGSAAYSRSELITQRLDMLNAAKEQLKSRSIA